MNRLTIVILFFSVISMLFSCQKSKVKNIPDVSHIEIDLNVKRFEKDLFTLDTMRMEEESKRLFNTYPLFMKDVFAKEIFPALQDPNILKKFIQSPQLRQLYDTCQIVYRDFDDLEKDFTEAFRFYKYHFPEKETPKLITYLSEYSIGAFTYESIVGVGLDFFLGADYPNYHVTEFPNYIKRSMNKEHLVAKTIEAVANDLVGNPKGNRLLDLMIHNGKIHYIMDQLIPREEDNIKMAYTTEQMKWVEDNELQIWTHLVGEELLYSTKYKDFRKLIDHSPNAPGMPAQAPGRTANWVGWQIVNAFMARHPEITLPQLLEITNAQKIMDQSKYKPRQ